MSLLYSFIVKIHTEDCNSRACAHTHTHTHTFYLMRLNSIRMWCKTQVYPSNPNMTYHHITY